MTEENNNEEIEYYKEQLEKESKKVKIKRLIEVSIQILFLIWIITITIFIYKRATTLPDINKQNTTTLPHKTLQSDFAQLLNQENQKSRGVVEELQKQKMLREKIRNNQKELQKSITRVKQLEQEKQDIREKLLNLSK